MSTHIANPANLVEAAGNPAELLLLVVSPRSKPHTRTLHLTHIADHEGIL